MAITKEEIMFELRAALTNMEPIGPQERLRFGDSFEALSFEQVRRVHAEDALRSPDACVAYSSAGVEMVAATKRVSPPGKRPFLLIVLALRESGGYAVHGAFRLYGEAGQLDDLVDNPTWALATFFDRYAIAHDAGGHESKFSTFLLQSLSPDGSLTFLTGPATSNRGAVSALVKNTGTHFEIAWPFVVDGDAYLADLRAA